MIIVMWISHRLKQSIAYSKAGDVYFYNAKNPMENIFLNI